MKKIILLLLMLATYRASAQEFKITDSIVIKLKSGSELTAIVTQNKAMSKPLPAIVRYSIYTNMEADKFFNSIACLRGYVGVTFYVRGKYLSNQKAEPFAHDAEDAYEMIDWVSKQSWCDGKVGMYGASYLGFSQWASVKNLHPALKTIVPQSAVGIGVDFPFHNNINLGYSLNWIHYASDNKVLDNKGVQEFADQRKWANVFNEWFISGKSFASLDSIEGRPNEQFQEWLRHPSFDDYWKKLTPTALEYAKLNIPVLTIAGYYDVDQSGAMHYFKEHHKNNKNADHYLILGPYDHFGLQQMAMPVSVGGYKIDSAAIFKIYKLTFDWFDYILKGSQKPSLLKEKVNFQVMGANRWEHAESLKKITSKKLNFFLSPVKQSGMYKLSKSSGNKNGIIRQRINFKDRNSTISAGNALVLDTLLHTDKNSLVFESDAFDQPMSIAGSLDGELSLNLNKKDLDITVQLYEKLANGNYLRLYNDMLRASYAKDHSKRQLLIPGKTSKIKLTGNTFFVSRKIAKGSKLVFILGVPVESGMEINYGTGKIVSQETIADADDDLQLEWHSNSHLSLSVLPGS
ncbi:CocE/NonD family hydrolase [Pedobacter miscanthi]|uniref:Peptidase S15 n=1 Tax=Pedobacter miscanthi TaxID=2259170 RepID=A0A366KL85_9SPHI|nr:CocE/NonD family hydrolase [Pedobacter miscanthi]RBQ01919.1 peptidase S15 [Pedobacter miscanthi]